MLFQSLLWCFFVNNALAAPKLQEKDLNVPKPLSAQEYAYVHSSGPGSRTISRKDKTEPERPFETSHKLPPSLTFKLNLEDEGVKQEENKNLKQIVKRAAPAPAGAITLNVKQLLEKYKDVIVTSTTTAKPSTKITRRAGRAKSSLNKSGNRRIKKDAEITTVTSVLTTSKILPKVDDTDDIPLVASGSEKQRSRIQIKKGPNGQEYEYEYVYYYYDDDEDPKETKATKKNTPVKEEITNAHDGPARNEIISTQRSRNPSRHRNQDVGRSTVAPESNEVVPASTRGRSRHITPLGEEDVVGEDRLPANTRFPPRSRNLNTTPLSEESSSERPSSSSRPRIRRPHHNTESAEPDSVTDETQGSRGRTRANVKRPSLELVDSDTFNTNFNGAGPSQAESQGGPSFPTDLPAGPVRFLGVTPNESVNLPSSPKEDDESVAPQQEPSSTTNEYLISEKVRDSTITEESTAATDPMDKVALDLYAISQGNQKMFGDSAGGPDEKDDDVSNEDATTYAIESSSSTTTTTTTTTTTSTTTTTPAPTTTTTTTTTPPPTTEASLFGRGRYKGRPGIHKKTTTHTSTTETAPNEEKKKKFNGRPSFGNRHRGGPKTTTESSQEEEKITKENAKPVSSGRHTSRNRFGTGARTRSRTTPIPSEETQDSNSISPSTSSPRSTRPRPSFNLRGRTRPTTSTAAPEEGSNEGSEASSEQTASTTVKSRRIQPGSHSAIRPLRPGPRINIAHRRIGHHGPTSTSTEISVQEENVSEDEKATKEEDTKEETSETAAPVDTNPLSRLRNRHRIQVGTAPRPKASASSPVQVRRINPLLARKRPGQKVEPSSETPAETQATEAATAVEEDEQPAEAVEVSSTTEEPRGLSKLLAGRRRLAGNHRAAIGNH